MSDQAPEDFYYVEPINGGLAHAIQIGDHQIMVIHRRKNYRGCSETPTKGPFGMNPKLAKNVSKFFLGALFSAAIGYAIKVEKKIEERIDEHYAESKADDQNND